MVNSVMLQHTFLALLMFHCVTSLHLVQNLGYPRLVSGSHGDMKTDLQLLNRLLNLRKDCLLLLQKSLTAKITKCIASKNSRQDSFPLIGRFCDKAVVEPLYLMTGQGIKIFYIGLLGKTQN